MNQKDEKMKIPGWNGIKKTRDAKRRVNEAKDDYLEVHAHYIAYADDVQDVIYRLGQLRIEAIQALARAVETMDEADVVDESLLPISYSELENIRVQTGTMARLNPGVSHAGVGVGTASGLTVGTISAIGAYGVVGSVGIASTGTAISALSGAAATNATMAALGGGALAAGGLGMAGGAAVLSGIFALPALAGIVIGAEAMGSKAEKKANEQIEMIRSERKKIDQEMAQLTAIRIRGQEIQRRTAYLTGSLTAAMDKVKGNWMQQAIAFLKRIFMRKRQTNPQVIRVMQIAKQLSEALKEPVEPQEQTHIPASTRRLQS